MVNGGERQDSKLEQDIHQWVTYAVENAQTFHLQLDFTPESVERVEQVLEFYARVIKDDRVPERAWNMAAVYGAYLGETILQNGARHCGYTWIEYEGLPALYKRSSDLLNPIGKTYKRLRGGSEESVSAFYALALTLAAQKNKTSPSAEPTPIPKAKKKHSSKHSGLIRKYRHLLWPVLLGAAVLWSVIWMMMR